MTLSPISLINSSSIEGLPQNEQLKLVSTQFVSILLSEIFNEMQKGIRSDLVPEQMGESWYHQWLMDIYAQDAAKQDFSQIVKLVDSQISPYKNLPSRETQNLSNNENMQK